MTPKEQLANDYFCSGYSCAQSVFVAFHEEMGLSEAMALRLMQAMGGGVSGLREICGAFLGAAMAINMMSGYEVRPGDAEGKKALYALVQAKAEAMKAQYGTYICRELLLKNGITPSPVPAVRTPRYYANRPCAEFVRFCAKMAEEEMNKR